MWLSSFIFPTAEGNAIRAETLVSICHIARGERVVVRINWAAYFINMMDSASTPEKNDPSAKTTPLPLHYWTGWFLCYCTESYPSRRPVGNARFPSSTPLLEQLPTGGPEELLLDTAGRRRARARKDEPLFEARCYSGLPGERASRCVIAHASNQQRISTLTR